VQLRDTKGAAHDMRWASASTVGSTASSH
jgi:hypothetical protein